MTVETTRSGLRNILLATAVAGILGYAIQLLAPVLLADDNSYVTFSVYWSTLYLSVATLSGVQQEVTRSARPVANEPPTPVLRQFGLIVILAAVTAVLILSVAFGAVILPGHTLLLAGALSVGVVGYLLVAVLGGVLYGLRLWSAVAWLTILDAAFRAVLVLLALAFRLPAGWIALAVSLPFGLAFLAVWGRVRGGVVGVFRLDVRLGRLLAHTGSTVVAAAAMGVMMNGLPVLLRLTVHGSGTSVLAGLILAITLTRAPIVVPLLALQSFLISVFRGGGRQEMRRILFALLTAAGGVGLLTVLAWLIGPRMVQLLSANRFEVASETMAFITAGAGIIAMMCITGPALVGHSRHNAYAAGWVVAALLTVVALLVPAQLPVRLPLALLVPPISGLVIHMVALHQQRIPAVETASSSSQDDRG